MRAKGIFFNFHGHNDDVIWSPRSFSREIPNPKFEIRPNLKREAKRRENVLCFARSALSAAVLRRFYAEDRNYSFERIPSSTFQILQIPIGTSRKPAAGGPSPWACFTSVPINDDP
jgi:hypothetical protein